MPPALERPIRQPADAATKFKSPEEELAYLREKVAEKEREMESPDNRFESDRIAKREIAAYGEIHPAEILHETVIMPEHDILRNVLKLEPEAHDVQMDELIKIIAERGIKNALSIVARMKNPHLEDDLHRVLIRYIAEGLSEGGAPPPERMRRALDLVLFSIDPQAHGEREKQDNSQHRLEQIL